MSIRLKLIIMFLAIATIPLLLVGVLTFHNYKDVLTANRLVQMQNIAQFKVERIEAFFTGIKKDIETAQSYYNVKNNLPILTRFAQDPNNTQFVAAKKMLDGQLRPMEKVFGLTDIMLVSPQGFVVYSSNPEHYPKDFSKPLLDPEKKAFEEGKSKIFISDIFFKKNHTDQTIMLVTAPAYDFNNAFIGVIALEVDANTVYDIIESAIGLGETGEVLIGKKTGNQVVYLNPLRHDPNAALVRKVDIGASAGRPIQEASQGKTGSGTYFDYRGVQVIAAWKYIPSLDWGMVAKIDAVEAFADVTNLRNLVAIILGIVIILSAITAFSIAKSISEPIKRLSEGAAVIGQGNLDYKLEIHQKDEIGQLSRSFDKMTSDLRQTLASRDELNKEIELRKKVEEDLREHHIELETHNEELRIAQRDLEQSRHQFADLFDFAPVGYVVLDEKGIITRANFLAVSLLGVEKQMVVNTPFAVFVSPEDNENFFRHKRETLENGKKSHLELKLRPRENIEVFVHLESEAVHDENDKVIGCRTAMTDITERKKAEREREATVEFLALVNESGQTRDLIEKSVAFFHKQSGCEAVGIRLKQGDDYPYYVARGFPQEFVQLENSLCARDLKGQLIRDDIGNPVIECMCGNIIQGRFDPSKPFFTTHGSFWTNCTTELLATTTEADRQARTRNRCNGAGYESVALLPLHAGDERIGLLQLNDKRKGQFSPEAIGLWERLADHLAVALAKFRAEEALSESKEDLNRAQAVGSVGNWRLDVLKNILTWSDENHRIFGIPQGTPMTYETFLSAIHPDDREYVDKKWKAALEGEDYDLEHRIVVDNQSPGEQSRTIKWVREKAYLDFDDKGELTGGFGITQDITRRKQMEDELRKSHDELEARVIERTADLDEAVKDLQKQVENRIRAEEKVKAERQQLNNVLETLPNYVCLLTPDYQMPFANRVFRETFGYFPDKKCYEFLFDRKEPCENCLTYNVLKTGKPQRWEWTGPNGRDYDIYDYPFTDTDGSKLILEMGIDVTEQKKAQNALRSASLYTRGLIEASLDPLVTISPDGKITDVNEATELATGLPRKQLVGSSFSNYFTDSQKANEGYKKVISEGFVKDYPLTIRNVAGKTIDVLYNATLYKDQAGQVTGIFAAARDITERKAAQEKQSVTNSLLELFVRKESRKAYLDSTVEIVRNWSGCEFGGIRIKDTEGNIPYESYVGFDKDFLAKENMLHISRDKCLCIRAITGESQKQEKNYMTAGGSFYINDSKAFINALSEVHKKEYRGNCITKGFQSIAVVPIRYRGEVYGAIHLTDYKKGMVTLEKIQFIESTITPLVGEAIQRFNAETELIKYRLHLEDLVKERTEDLARSNRDLEQFAYVASHDLQEPLRAVAGFTELLRRNLKASLDDKSSEYMDFSIDGVKRMQTLISGLLDYSRIGTQGKKPEQTDSKAALDIAISHLQTSIKESGAKITTDGLPMIHYDSLQLTQLFQNLISNAIKFRGDKTPEIHISAVKTDDAWRFAVADNGIGIDQQYADKIFLIFQRLHSREKYPGTGIGLSICKKIVERHNGKIWVESQPGMGSTFYFTAR